MAAVSGVRTMTRYCVGAEQKHKTVLLNKHRVLEEHVSFKSGIVQRAELSPL